MGEVLDPAIQRRRLIVELREARARAGLTQKQVAEALDWSPAKVIRIENGKVPITTTDLRALLMRYGVTDATAVDDFVRMAQESRKQTWDNYRDVLTPEFLTYLGYEGTASLFRQAVPLFIPGLLQIEDYARAVIRTFGADTSEDVMDRQVELRLARQSIFDRASPPQLFFILDEAVVRRWVGNTPGSPTTMRRQLERLVELNERPFVSIQVLEFTVGSHLGMSGPFTILEFANASDDDLLFLETARGTTVTRDDPDQAAKYKDAFFQLEKLALSKEDSSRFMQGVIRDMNGSSVR